MSYNWDVIRTTTDKLANELNELAWDVHQVQFIGGRDWVIICRQNQERPIYSGKARRSKDGTLWEITLPSMGPNDESIKTTASQAENIDMAAKLAIANMNGWAPEEFDVDIEVDTRPVAVQGR